MNRAHDRMMRIKPSANTLDKTMILDRGLTTNAIARCDAAVDVEYLRCYMGYGDGGTFDYSRKALAQLPSNNNNSLDITNASTYIALSRTQLF